MKIVCVDNYGAALTVGRVYEARRDVNYCYYRLMDDDGHKGTFLERRFRPYRAGQQSRSAT